MTTDPNYRLAMELHARALSAAAAGWGEEAIELLRQAVALSPGTAALHGNLGVLLSQAGRVGEAIESFRRTLELQPEAVAAINNLSNAYLLTGQVDAAIEAAKKSLAIDRSQAEAFNALGNALKDAGQVPEAIEAYRKAMDLRPELGVPGSNWLYAQHFADGVTAKTLLETHRAWGEIIAETHTPSRGALGEGRVKGDFQRGESFDVRNHPHPNPLPGYREREPENTRAPLPVAANPAPGFAATRSGVRDARTSDRIRIGYVSPDLFEHPVGRFLLPILEHHDRARFHITAYSGTARGDSMTELIRGSGDAWVETARLSDGAMAERIRADEIDVLVDLSLHMRGNRLRVFANTPAPVQVTYLGYCSTSGLAEMDWRLTDACLDPAGAEVAERDAMYVERSWRLPSYWCYAPPAAAPEVSEPPCVRNAFVTFGCFNNICKVSDRTLKVWRMVLEGMPGSRMIIHAPEGSARRRVLDGLQVESSRVEFIGRVPHADYLALHGRVDIALDPMPCCGGTTTCDALWMGLPTVSLVGDAAVARSGLSVLTACGLNEWAAGTEAEYVQKALALAGNRPELERLRREMRDRMRESRLMDSVAHVRAMEEALVEMLRRFHST